MLEVGVYGLSEQGCHRFFKNLEELFDNDLSGKYSFSGFDNIEIYPEKDAMVKSIRWEKDCDAGEQQLKDIMKSYKTCNERLRRLYLWLLNEPDKSIEN